MELCLIFMLSNGFALGTVDCQNQLYFGNGLVTPHEVVYNSHPEEYWEGYLYYIPTHKLHFTSKVRVLRHRTARMRHVKRLRRYNRLNRHNHRLRGHMVDHRRHKRHRYKHKRRIYKKKRVLHHHVGGKKHKKRKKYKH
jgi:hypothetical protein